MRIFIFLIFLFTSSNTFFSQTILCPQNKRIDRLIDSAIEASKIGKSKEAISYLEESISLSKTENCSKGEMYGYKNLMLQYAKVSNYKKSLEAANEAENLALKLEDHLNLTTIYKTKATVYDILGLFQESIKQYELALKQASKIENKDIRHYEKGFIYFSLATYYQDSSLKTSEEYLKKSKMELLQIKNLDNNTNKKKNNLLVSIDMNLGLLYKDDKNPQKDILVAESHFLSALKDIENGNTDTKIDLLDALIGFYYDKNEFDKAISYGEKMLVLEKNHSMPYNRKSAYMQLAKSYLGIGNNEFSQKYLELYTKINDSIIIEEKKAVEKPIDEAISKNEKKYTEKLQITLIVAGVLILTFICVGLVLWNKKRKALHKRYEILIQGLKDKNPVSIVENTPKTEDDIVPLKTKNIYIADKTLDTLLSKLEKFESSNRFTRQDISFPYLVSYLGTNSKYLNEILKIHKSKSFSQYINDLRIDYIIKLLYEDPKYREYKISYLAEKCGFSSREFFATTFKKKTGISPSYFIEHLRDDE